MQRQTDRKMHSLARQAKHRITSGYYTKEAAAERKAYAVRRTLADKVVYDKIVDIVRHDGTVTDVIASLIDSSVFDNADEAARERSVRTAAATYRKVKREYESRAAAGNVAL